MGRDAKLMKSASPIAAPTLRAFAAVQATLRGLSSFDRACSACTGEECAGLLLTINVIKQRIPFSVAGHGRLLHIASLFAGAISEIIVSRGIIVRWTDMDQS